MTTSRTIVQTHAAEGACRLNRWNSLSPSPGPCTPTTDASTGIIWKGGGNFATIASQPVIFFPGCAQAIVFWDRLSLLLFYLDWGLEFNISVLALSSRVEEWSIVGSLDKVQVINLKIFQKILKVQSCSWLWTQHWSLSQCRDTILPLQETTIKDPVVLICFTLEYRVCRISGTLILSHPRTYWENVLSETNPTPWYPVSRILRIYFTSIGEHWNPKQRQKSWCCQILGCV